MAKNITKIISSCREGSLRRPGIGHRSIVIVISSQALGGIAKPRKSIFAMTFLARPFHCMARLLTALTDALEAETQKM
jgi:hypothetical protein